MYRGQAALSSSIVTGGIISHPLGQGLGGRGRQDNKAGEAVAEATFPAHRGWIRASFKGGCLGKGKRQEMPALICRKSFVRDSGAPIFGVARCARSDFTASHPREVEAHSSGGASE